MANNQIENSVILIVDDDKLSVEILKHILEAEGYGTDSASNGPEALKKARSGNVCLILQDIVLLRLECCW